MSAVDEVAPAPPRELVVDATPAPGDSSDGAGSAMAPFAMTALVAGALAKYVSPAVAAAALVGGTIVLFLLRKPREGRFVLRVDDDGALEVTRERRRGPAVRVALADLLDVTLERQTHNAGGRGGATERVRLALERQAPNGPIFVPEERVTPIEAQEWYGKVRVFLRKHGWVPADERGAAPPST